MNDAERAVMDTAHRSWEQKKLLAYDIATAIDDHMMNAYREWSTFRLASPAAAYEQAQSETRRVIDAAFDHARTAVQMEMTKNR